MYGQQLRNIDDKNRVVMPPVFRDQLGSIFYLTIGFDGNAELRSKNAYQEYVSIIENKSRFDAKVRTLSRYIMGNTFELTIDNQNRVMLPKLIIDQLSIQKEVIFVGVGSLVELWSKEKYDEITNKITGDDIAALAQLISES
ncbi:division/cell wall cluster transcriptional repressor MraZ [Mycoplasma sp. Pen4]|uniref:division/cell wall cluster transcriptional repressor MraZ n=1 Tax=Mycoplasma sp. Pen4 TaxID=640330 RepID=UPI0016548217|nr:division/cell wall cluster transcriptional repressor MraZ [Mycoplasma sp. Pen4]QNM93717.1 division/cell wall cluster transcriptional repressor MraZ [Mycoplasma sp. Pen4]